MKLDYLVIQPHMDPYEAEDVAERRGFDAKDAIVQVLPLEKQQQWFSSNCAYRRLPEPVESFPESWLSCFVVRWDDLES